VVVPTALRKALVVRDEHCAFPGCDRPQSWCDAHHVVHWADGGETNLDNLLLLCRPHHRMLHNGFGVEMARGRATFRRPDGSPIAPCGYDGARVSVRPTSRSRGA
jgi:HNH endonuclease